MRLDKFLCKSTDLDRKAARVTILSGSITVNGAIATDCAMQVHENNTVSLNGKPLAPRPYLVLKCGWSLPFAISSARYRSRI